MKSWFISSAPTIISLVFEFVANFVIKKLKWSRLIPHIPHFVLTSNSWNSCDDRVNETKAVNEIFRVSLFRALSFIKFYDRAHQRVTSATKILRILFTVCSKRHFSAFRRGGWVWRSAPSTILNFHEVEKHFYEKSECADAFTMFVIVAKIEMIASGCWWGFQRVGQLLWKIFMWGKTFSVDFRSWKWWESLEIFLRDDFPIHCFISHHQPITFESIESVIVWWSSSVLNGIFSRSNLKFGIKIRRRTFRIL